MFLCERCWGEAGDGTGPVDEAWKMSTTTLERMSMVDVTSLLSAERRARRGGGSDERRTGYVGSVIRRGNENEYCHEMFVEVCRYQ